MTQAKDIIPVAYEEGCPFPYNNYIYRLELVSPATESSFVSGSPQPFTTTPPPEGVSTVIFRLSNPFAFGVNDANRLENEIASLELARGALKAAGAEYKATIPAVYAWKTSTYPNPPGESSFGWAFMEFRLGVDLNTVFKEMPFEEKKAVVEQVADVFAALQGAKLPEGVKAYGGLTIDDSGAIVSGQMTTAKGGPWSQYWDLWAGRFRGELSQADESPVIQGWKPNGVRVRIDQFLESGLEKELRAAGVDTSLLVLVHGDLSRYF